MMHLKPSTSHIGPPNIIVSVKPQKAVPLIQPICSLVSPNSDRQMPIASPRKARLIAVTIKAMQLAQNNCVNSIASLPIFWT